MGHVYRASYSGRMRATTGLAVIGFVLAVVSGIEILAHGPLYHIDYRVALNFAPITASRSSDVARFLASVGRPWIACTAVGGLAAVVTALTRRTSPAVAAIVGLAGIGVAVWLLKETFPRLSIGFNHPGSFPSGHTGVAVVASGLAVYLLLPRVEWRERLAVLVAALWGIVMAWGRVVTDTHWLSDVLAGWGIGITVLVLALRTADSPLGTRGWARSAPADR